MYPKTIQPHFLLQIIWEIFLQRIPMPSSSTGIMTLSRTQDLERSGAESCRARAELDGVVLRCMTSPEVLEGHVF